MGINIEKTPTPKLIELLKKERHISDYEVVLTKAQKKAILYNLFVVREESNLRELIPDNMLNQIIGDILPANNEQEANFYLADLLTENQGSREKYQFFSSKELVERFRSHMVAKLEPDVSLKFAEEIFGELRRRLTGQDLDKTHTPHNLYSLKRDSITYAYVQAMLVALLKEDKRDMKEKVVQTLIIPPLFDLSNDPND